MSVKLCDNQTTQLLDKRMQGKICVHKRHPLVRLHSSKMQHKLEQQEKSYP